MNNKKVLAIIQARTGSSRLPGKVLKNLNGHPVLWHIIQRVLCARTLDSIIVATTISPEDNVIENFCIANGILFYRGSVENVLERYYKVAKKYHVKTIVRITADCPLIDPKIIDSCVKKFKKSNYDYLSNVVPGEGTCPQGLDVEVFTFETLAKTYKNAREPYEKEHVTPYIWENTFFKIAHAVKKDTKCKYRLTLDYPEDFILLKEIYQKLYKPDSIIPIKDVLNLLNHNPSMAKINANCGRKPLRE